MSKLVSGGESLDRKRRCVVTIMPGVPSSFSMPQGFSSGREKGDRLHECLRKEAVERIRRIDVFERGAAMQGPISFRDLKKSLGIPK